MAKLPEYINFYCKPVVNNYKIEGVDRWVIDAYEALPVDKKAAVSTITNAENWSKGYGRYSAFKFFTMINDPIYDIIIIGKESRGGNGKIYKVIVHGKYYIDLHLQHLLDILINGHIENGMIKSPMVFVRCSGGLRLLRLHSKDYNDAIKVIKKPKPIHSQDIEFGNVYNMRNYYGDEVFKVQNRHTYTSTGTNVVLTNEEYLTFNPNLSHINYTKLSVLSNMHISVTDDFEKITGDVEAHYKEIIKYYSNSELMDGLIKFNDLREICRIVAILNTVDNTCSWPNISPTLAKLHTAFINNRH